jgi:hypothetical protein
MRPSTIQTLEIDSDLERDTFALLSTTTSTKESLASVYACSHIRRSATVDNLNRTLEQKQAIQLCIRELRNRNNHVNVFRFQRSGFPTPATQVVARDSNLDRLIEGFVEIASGPGDDWVKPTLHAFRNAIRTVPKAYGLVKTDGGRLYVSIPVPSFSTDDVGGIRLGWKRDNRVMRINFGADPNLRSYLYFEHDRVHGIEQLDEETLAKRLRWLTAI